MRPLLTPRALIVLLLCSLIFFYNPSSASAQDIVGGAGRTDLSGGAGGGNTGSGNRGGGGSRRPSVRYVTNTRTVTVTKTVKVTPTTGTLAVAAESNAELLIEPINIRGGEGQEGRVPTGERIFIFNDLKPGRYRVAAELEGYAPVEEEIMVSANKSASVTLDLKPISHTITIRTNVNTGEIRYAPVQGRRDPQTGEMKYDPIGKTTLVRIQQGRALLDNLREGTYGLDIRADEVGYQTLLATITLPGKTDVEAPLNKILSSKTFSATWASLDGWEMPGTWRVANRKLAISGSGVAIPKDESYRYYADFQLSSDVKMINGVAASFALRAKDPTNYYLIQLTGQSADEPYVLRSYIVENGVPRRMAAPIPIDGFVGTLKAGQFFNVSMIVKGNNINVSITDSQTGEVLPLGILTDPNGQFKIGAVGIAVKDREQNEVGRFIVCSPECPRS
jgi:hypothetical protein